VDFIIRKDQEYRLAEFKRRKKITIADFTTYIVSIEDLIISKLNWMRDSDSELQKNDVKSLLLSAMITNTSMIGSQNSISPQHLSNCAMNDTSADVNSTYRRLLANLTGEGRLRLASESFESAKIIVRASFSDIHDELVLRKEMFLRFYGADMDDIFVRNFFEFLIEREIKNKN
jgi:hypothetical protein